MRWDHKAAAAMYLDATCARLHVKESSDANARRRESSCWEVRLGNSVVNYLHILCGCNSNCIEPTLALERHREHSVTVLLTDQID